ncbi:MAG: serine/threonine-protein kinase, partial [Pseudonocardiales bacterium]|nr:serine/threonine-protein kinase [Pseudonocardiales bacterium]
MDEVVGGRYRLREEIGSGGMGVVWRATDELLAREVALKRVRLDLLDHDAAETMRQRTLREARIAAALHHPHVVSIFDVLIVDGDPWLVLEYLPSESLAAAVAARGPLAPADAAALGALVADALAAAHAAGITHRDVKPANVLLGRGGTVKLTDFGISHATGDVTLTRADHVSGTPAYLAPEVARGTQGDAAADVYSLGATLYTAVEGHPPFGHSHGDALRMLQVVATTPPPAPQRAGALTGVLSRLMSLDPARRPGAAEAAGMLREVAARRGADPRAAPFAGPPPTASPLAASPLAAPPPTGPPPGAPPWS